MSGDALSVGLAQTLQKVNRVLAGSDRLVVTTVGAERYDISPDTNYGNINESAFFGATDGVEVMLNFVQAFLAVYHGEALYEEACKFDHRVEKVGLVDGDKFYKAFPSTWLDNRHLGLLLGLNYHELAHVLFTPFSTSPLFKEIKASPHEGLAGTHNIMEDARIENLFLNLYPEAEPFLTTLVSTVILNADHVGLSEEAASVSDWLLTNGRVYMPAAIRKRVYEDVADKDLADEIFEIQAEFMKLDMIGSWRKAYSCVLQMHLLLKKSLPDEAVSASATAAEAEVRGKDSTDGTPTSSANNDSKAPSAVEEAARGALTDLLEESFDGNAAGPDGDGDDEESGAGADGTAGGIGDDDGDSVSADGDSGKSASAGGGDAGSGGASEDLADVILRELDEIEKATEAAVDDVRESAWDATRHPNNRQTGVYPLHAVNAETHEETRRLRLVFEELAVQLDRGVVRGVEDGELNVDLWLDADDGDDRVFDDWEADMHESSAAEIVILFDTSGSMQQHDAAVSRQVWMLRRALEVTDVSLTVVEFNSEHFILAGPGDYVSPSEYEYARANGGTVIKGAINHASRVFAASELEHKVLIVMTDGSVVDRDAYESAMADIVASGVDPYCLFFGFEGTAIPQFPEEHVYQNVHDPATLRELAAKIVEGIIKRSLTSR